MRAVNVTKFVAEDGTEFDFIEDCMSYEASKAETILEGVKKMEDFGYAPFDGSENMEYDTYEWYHIQTKDDVNKINRYLDKSEYTRHRLNDYNIGDWVCIISDEHEGVKWLSLLSESIDYAKEVLADLGYKMTLEKISE